MNDLHKPAILIVDDEKDFRQTFRYKFQEDLGYTVFEAGDGEEGLEMAIQHSDELGLVPSGTTA